MNITNIKVLCIILLSLFTCFVQGQKADSTVNYDKKLIEVKKISFDTSTFILDTIYDKIDISDSKYKLRIFRNKFDDNFNKYEDNKIAPLILLLSDSTGDLFCKSLGSNENKGFLNEIEIFKINKELNEQGKMFVCFKIFGDGAGSSNFLYHFTKDETKFKLVELFNYGTESIVIFSENGSILFLEEVWGKDETFFDCHKYKIKEFIFENGYFSENEIGISKLKHCLSDSQNLKVDLNNFFQKESSFFKEINVQSYLNMIE